MDLKNTNASCRSLTSGSPKVRIHAALLSRKGDSKNPCTFPEQKQYQATVDK